MPHVDKLILEMLTNRTPPTCIQANLVAMAELLCPNMDVIKELPSLKHIKNLRTALYTITKTLAAYRLANAKTWKQGHSDETSRRQTSLLNFLMGVITSDDQFKTICLDLAIISKNGTAVEQSRAVLSALRDCEVLLRDWRTKTTEMYPNRPELIELIPDPALIDVTRFVGVMIEHDSCNTARKFGSLFCESIREAIGERITEANVNMMVLEGDCHNHLRNVWFEHIDSDWGSLLEDHLKADLAIIPTHLRVSCRLSEILIQCDKEYNFSANYPKGHGDEFHDWLKRYHPDKHRLPIIRVSGGNRQDSSFEGALPLYDGLDEMLAFTNECLQSSSNKLQRCLMITLGSVEVIAQLRVASIMYLSVIVPLRWLAGNTHKLAHRNWGERSMGKALDLLHESFVKIRSDPSLLLKEPFIMNIFKPLYAQLPELKEYLNYYREEKVGNTVGSFNEEDRVLAIDQAISEVFYPTKVRNRETTPFCHILAERAATTLLVELEDPKKATHMYLSSVSGKRSQAVITRAEERATFGMRSNNDPSEGSFATLTDVLQMGGRISLASAAAIGQARYNKDMYRDIAKLVSGKRSKKVAVEGAEPLGLFHTIPEELCTSLVAMAKSRGKRTRSKFNADLLERRQAYYEKMQLEKEEQLKHAEKAQVDALFLHKQYHSRACWKTVGVARSNYDKLQSKKDKYKHVKENILIRYLGFGWVEAHHPWSATVGGHKHTFSPDELFKHLVDVVIPLTEVKQVPDFAPVNLPDLPDGFSLGSRSAVRKDLDEKRESLKDDVRRRAKIEMDRLEESGVTDGVEYMQEASWPVDRLLEGDSEFKIQVCWMFQVDDGDGFISEELRWCSGVVTSLVRDKSDKYNFVDVEVEWNEEWVEVEDERFTVQRLKRKDFNPSKPFHGAWREDLSDDFEGEMI